MPITKRKCVGKALELLTSSLKPFVERELKSSWGEKFTENTKILLIDTRLQARGGADGTPLLNVALLVIMEIEGKLGFVPTDRDLEKLGYDIESRIPGTGRLRFIEVKGRVTGAATVTFTRNEILYSLNKPDDFILAIVEFDCDTHRVHYIREPFRREPDFGVTSVNYGFAELLAKATTPS